MNELNHQGSLKIKVSLNYFLNEIKWYILYGYICAVDEKTCQKV